MRLRLSIAINVMILLLMVPAISRADAVYTFSGSTVPSAYLPSTDAWSADVSSTLTTTTTITAFLSESTTGVLGTDGCTIASVEIINPSSALELATTFNSSCPLTTFTLVLGLPDTHFGTLTDGNDTLTIAPAASTPEPSSVLLLGIVMLFLGILDHGFHRVNYLYSALKFLH